VTCLHGYGLLHFSSGGYLSYLKPDEAEEADSGIYFFQPILSDVNAKRRGQYGMVGIGMETTLFKLVLSPLPGAWSALTGPPRSLGWKVGRLYPSCSQLNIGRECGLYIKPSSSLKIAYPSFIGNVNCVGEISTASVFSIRIS
jgi:hypothetical protein